MKKYRSISQHISRLLLVVFLINTVVPVCAVSGSEQPANKAANLNKRMNRLERLIKDFNDARKQYDRYKKGELPPMEARKVQAKLSSIKKAIAATIAAILAAIGVAAGSFWYFGVHRPAKEKAREREAIEQEKWEQGKIERKKQKREKKEGEKLKQEQEVQEEQVRSEREQEEARTQKELEEKQKERRAEEQQKQEEQGRIEQERRYQEEEQQRKQKLRKQEQKEFEKRKKTEDQAISDGIEILTRGYSAYLGRLKNKAKVLKTKIQEFNQDPDAVARKEIKDEEGGMEKFKKEFDFGTDQEAMDDMIKGLRSDMKSHKRRILELDLAILDLKKKISAPYQLHKEIIEGGGYKGDMKKLNQLVSELAKLEKGDEDYVRGVLLQKLKHFVGGVWASSD